MGTHQLHVLAMHSCCLISGFVCSNLSFLFLRLSVVEKLLENGIIAAPLFGGNEKTDRSDVCRALREGNVGCVVATEMAARGIDAPFLTHVINADLPTDASHYAHRAGRAGRGGRPGIVINFTCNVKERKVPYKFADELGVPMHTIAPRAGKLIIINDATDAAINS